MRTKFNAQLEKLNNELIQMGALCESAIDTSVDALMAGDTSLVKIVNQREKEIDDKEREIENLCLKMLLQQQPVASDLRSISAALKMVTDLERIGDQAADIGEMIGYLENYKMGEVELIGQMAKCTKDMVRQSIDAFVKRDIALAKDVIEYDNVVDDIFRNIKKSLISSINSNAVDGEFAVDLLMVAKYFERIGDHAVNVAEWVEFSLTGHHRGDEDL